MDTQKYPPKERILRLTLEIIYLLTGEDYGPIRRKPSDHGNPYCRPKPPFLAAEGNNQTQILQITNKIIQLLTGEVAIRCLDVAVYLSVEEREYLEGHSDLYKKKDQRLFTDESKKSNQPWSCPQFPDSVNSPHDEHPTLQEHEHKPAVTEMPTAIKEEKPEVQIKEEKHSSQISRDGLIGSPPEGCPSPDDSHHSAKEDGNSNDFQEEDKNVVFPEVDRAVEQVDHKIKQEEEPLAIASADGRYWASTSSEESLATSSDGRQHDMDSPRESPMKAVLLPVPPCPDPLVKFSTHSGHLMDKSNGSNSSRVEGRFPCPDCGKAFNYRGHLLTHQITHTQEKPFSCGICGKKFAHKTSLADHHKIHTGEKPFSCPFCGKGFIQKSKMTRHQRTHTGEKPYMCSECDRCFAYRSSLIDHQRTHACDTLFPCADCGKCFTHKNSVLAHQKIHTGEKPYGCTLCGKFFARKSYLAGHHKVHTREKPFPCSDCEQRFAHRSTLVKHQNTHKIIEVPREKALQKIQLSL